MEAQEEQGRILAWSLQEVWLSTQELDHELQGKGVSARERLRAVDLLGMLLLPSPQERIRSFDEVLHHVLFQPDGTMRTESSQLNERRMQPPKGARRRSWTDMQKSFPSESKAGSSDQWTMHMSDLHMAAALGRLECFDKIATLPKDQLRQELSSTQHVLKHSVLHVATTAGQTEVVARLLAFADEQLKPPLLDLNVKDGAGLPVVSAVLEAIEFAKQKHRKDQLSRLLEIVEMIATHPQVDLSVADSLGRSAYVRGMSLTIQSVQELFTRLQFENEVMDKLVNCEPFDTDIFEGMWSHLENGSEQQERLLQTLWNAITQSLTPPVSHASRVFLFESIFPLSVFDAAVNFERLQVSRAAHSLTHPLTHRCQKPHS